VTGATLIGLPATLIFGWIGMLLAVFSLDMFFQYKIPWLGVLQNYGMSVMGLAGMACYWRSLASIKSGYASQAGKIILNIGPLRRYFDIVYWSQFIL
jgi:hypothetical protein